MSLSKIENGCESCDSNHGINCAVKTASTCKMWTLHEIPENMQKFIMLTNRAVNKN